MITKAVHPAVYTAVHKVDCTPWQYLDYNFYTDFTRSSTDQADDLAMSNASSAGKKDYLGNTYGENVPVIEPGKGLLMYGEYTNTFLWSEDITKWDSSGSPVITSTTFKATARFDSVGETTFLTLDGEYYTVSFTAFIPNGAQATNYKMIHVSSESGNTTDLTLSSTMQRYSATFLGKSGGGFVYAGFRDDNTSNWATVTITDFQITKSAYSLPYVKTTSATVTVPKSSADADEGSKYAISAGSKLEVAIDGMRFGQLVDNGGMELDSGWIDRNSPTSNERSTEQVHSGTYSRKVVPSAQFDGVKATLNESLVAGDTYELSVWCYGSGHNIQIRTNPPPVSSPIINTTMPTSWNEYKSKFVAGSSGAHTIDIYVGAPLFGTFYIDDVSIQKVSPAQGRMIVEWRPAFNAAVVSTDVNIITANDDATSFLFWDQSENKLSLYDGTNTATVACTPVSGTLYTIIADYDGTTGMRLTLDSSAGSVETFAGGFPCTADNLSFGWDEATPQYVESLKFEEHPSW